MAASSWVDVLKSHQLWEKIKSPKEKEKPVAQQILAIKDDVLFIWNFSKEVLLSLNLRSIDVSLSQHGKSYSKSNSEQDFIYQTLLLSTQPEFHVSWLRFNLTGSLFAVGGKRGVIIGILPDRWGEQGNFEGGKETITVRSRHVAEHFFVSNHNVELVEALWHPGSTTDTHLVILSSDNYIRIYNVNDALAPFQAIRIGADTASAYMPGSTHTFSSCLGESVVSFDFGPPDQRKETQESSVWPVFILLENGDIYMFLSDLEKKSGKPAVVGPLEVQPPADDNYGMDACSLLCLRNNPPVLAVATSSGKIHHSILLNNNDDKESDWRDGGSTSSSDQQPSLYVYESVELSLTLVNETTAALTEDNTAVQLHRDPFNLAKYYATHNAGVHAVVIPFIQQLDDFVSKNDDEQCELPCERPCILEHVLCSQPVAQQSTRSVMGLSFVTSPSLGYSLVVVVDPGKPIIFPLSVHYQPPPETLLADNKTPSTVPISTQKEPLEQHIQNILKRTNMQPFLVAGEDLNPTPQQCLQLLTRATASLREHVLRLDTAREDIERRVKVLKIQKEHQLKELENLKQVRDTMRKHAEAVADRYETLQENQQQIGARLEDILLRIEQQSPVISDAEKAMQKELKEIEEKLPKFQSDVKQLSDQQKYQNKYLEQHKFKKRDDLWGTGLSDNQFQHLHDLIKDEGKSITDLRVKLDELKLKLGI